MIISGLPQLAKVLFNIFKHTQRKVAHGIFTFFLRDDQFSLSLMQMTVVFLVLHNCTIFLYSLDAEEKKDRLAV